MARRSIARGFGTPRTGLLGWGISVVQSVSQVTEHSSSASQGGWYFGGSLEMCGDPFLFFNNCTHQALKD